MGRSWQSSDLATWTPLQAGAHVRDDAVANLTQLIGEAEELHTYSVHRLYSALAEDISQVSLLSPQVQLTNPVDSRI